jgi:hypothetical protein
MVEAIPRAHFSWHTTDPFADFTSWAATTRINIGLYVCASNQFPCDDIATLSAFSSQAFADETLQYVLGGAERFVKKRASTQRD